MSSRNGCWCAGFSFRSQHTFIDIPTASLMSCNAFPGIFAGLSGFIKCCMPTEASLKKSYLFYFLFYFCHCGSLVIICYHCLLLFVVKTQSFQQKSTHSSDSQHDFASISLHRQLLCLTVISQSAMLHTYTCYTIDNKKLTFFACRILLDKNAPWPFSIPSFSLNFHAPQNVLLCVHIYIEWVVTDYM